MSTFDLVLIGFFAGLLIAGALGIYCYRQLRIQLTLLHVVNDLIQALITLNSLRANNVPGAIEENETELVLRRTQHFKKQQTRQAVDHLMRLGYRYFNQAQVPGPVPELVGCRAES